MGEDSVTYPVTAADPCLTNIVVIVKKPQAKKIKIAKKKPEQVIAQKKPPSLVIKSRNVETSSTR